MPFADNIVGNIPVNIPGDILGGASVSFTRNMVPANFTNFLPAFAAARAGTGQCIIGCIGDSRTAGYGAGIGSSAIQDGHYRGGPPNLATYLTTAGYSADSNNILGTGLTGSTMATYNSFNRTSITGGATASTNSLGGNYYRFTAGVAGTWVFPLAACTEIRISYYANAGQGTFSWSIDGGAATNIDTSVGGPNYLVSTIATGLANTTHTVTLTYVSGTSLMGGVAGYGGNKVYVLNGGGAGMTTSNWYDSNLAYSPTNSMKKWAPHLSIINLGTNDSSVATAQTQLTNTINALKAGSSDVIIVVPSGTSAGNWNAIQADMRTMMLALSDTLSVGCIDLMAYGGGYAAMNAAGRMFDTIHENELGSEFEWSYINSAILSLVV